MLHFKWLNIRASRVLLTVVLWDPNWLAVTRYSMLLARLYSAIATLFSNGMGSLTAVGFGSIL